MTLHYVEAGDGPLVVLLHGFPEFWYGWRSQIAPLAAAGYRVVAPDLRCYNLSSKPDCAAAYTAAKLGDDVRDLIHERGAESAHLVGHDWGGTAAWTAAMNHPDVVDRLAILNAAHPRKLNEGLRHPSQLARSWYFFYFALPDLPEHHVRAKDWEFFQHFLRDAQPPYTDEETARYIEAWSQDGAAEAMIDYYRAAVRPPKGTKTNLTPIAAPTLVIWGEKDRYLGPDASRRRPSPARATGSRGCAGGALQDPLRQSRSGTHGCRCWRLHGLALQTWFPPEVVCPRCSPAPHGIAPVKPRVGARGRPASHGPAGPMVDPTGTVGACGALHRRSFQDPCPCSPPGSGSSAWRRPSMRSGTPYNQCDNMAGTCIRERQQAAIIGLQLLCVAGAVASALVAYGWRRWRPLWRWLAAAPLITGVGAAVFVLAADPINHLNNRWSGWLSV
ncbi:MAG TPA: alpha/beta hydrolase [Baekduia sp.]